MARFIDDAGPLLPTTSQVIAVETSAKDERPGSWTERALTLYPETATGYRRCLAARMPLGACLLEPTTDRADPCRYVAFLCTRRAWAVPATGDAVERCLRALSELLRERPSMTTISLGPLGCGAGELDPATIATLARATFSDREDDHTIRLCPTPPH